MDGHFIILSGVILHHWITILIIFSWQSEKQLNSFIPDTEHYNRSADVRTNSAAKVIQKKLFLKKFFTVYIAIFWNVCILSVCIFDMFLFVVKDVFCINQYLLMKQNFRVMHYSKAAFTFPSFLSWCGWLTSNFVVSSTEKCAVAKSCLCLFFARKVSGFRNKLFWEMNSKAILTSFRLLYSIFSLLL